jgi:hypothetical protein
MLLFDAWQPGEGGLDYSPSDERTPQDASAGLTSSLTERVIRDKLAAIATDHLKKYLRAGRIESKVCLTLLWVNFFLRSPLFS